MIKSQKIEQKFSFRGLIVWTLSFSILMSGILLSLHVMSVQANETEMPRCMPDEELLSEIKKRRQELDLRQQTLLKKEEEIATREKVLKEEFKKLEDLRGVLSSEKTVQNSKMEERVAKLVETMQTMSPKASSKLMSEIDEDLAVEAMSRMTTPKLAKILNLIESSKASILSEKLAGKEGKRKPASVPANQNAKESAATPSASENASSNAVKNKNLKSAEEKSLLPEKKSEVSPDNELEVKKSKGGLSDADSKRTG